MKQQATPGPWYVNESRMTVEAIDHVYGNGIVIAKPNTQADGRLISSAPDLLEAALALWNASDELDVAAMPSEWHALRKAIAKARGE